MEDELHQVLLACDPENENAEQTVHGNGKGIARISTGGWKASFLIIVFQIAERLAYAGVSSNLISYLTEVMHMSTVSATLNVTVWSGTSSLLPLLAAFVADSFLGCFRTVLYCSFLYILGLLSLTLSASLPNLRPEVCEKTSNPCPRASTLQLAFVDCSLMLTALGHAGHKPCLQAFGADQFDELDPKERKNKISFFNWWYFLFCLVGLLLTNVIIYIQETSSWGLGFLIPTLLMTVAFGVYLLGTQRYRYRIPQSSPFAQIARVFAAAFRGRNSTVPAKSEEKASENDVGMHPLLANQYRFLNRAITVAEGDDKVETETRSCTVKQVEEVKLVLRLLPIWATCLMYGTTFQLYQTFFVKQGKTMERKISANFEIPAASMQSFIGVAIILLLPLYDLVFVPAMRKITGNERGISLLQRMGTGLFIVLLTMITAAVVEMKRLKVVDEFKLQDEPNAMVPMSIAWLLPQYILLGTADVFIHVGMQEFFYDQISDSLRSMGMALNLSCFGVGGYIISLLVSVIKKFSGLFGDHNWLDDNLNSGHLDYFYWVVAALSTVTFCFFLSCSTRFIYKEVQRQSDGDGAAAGS